VRPLWEIRAIIWQSNAPHAADADVWSDGRKVFKDWVADISAEHLLGLTLK